MTATVLIGSHGMLGRELDRALSATSFDLTRYPDRAALDITDRAAVAAALPDSTALVVNAAGYTAVDDAEADAPAAMRLNAHGPAHLAERCRAIGATLVHFSTDYVFGGDHDAPIPVDAAPRPLNVYGLTKLAGERAVRRSGCDHLIVRTSGLLAPHGTNFVRTILRLAAAQDTLAVVDDQRGRPTACDDLAALTVRLLQAGAGGTSGTVHAGNDGDATWYDLARTVVAEAGLDCRVDACGTDRFPRPARRPRSAVLDLARTVAITGLPRGWRDAVRVCVGRCLAPDRSEPAAT